ncbi:hypothetical protein CJ739_3761 [Mariniflexile rhizosphaerae]|uniref:glycosyl-4,4'-diaponeurosporenoate acyltransferase CrtO family protein n=1 Tax=unclassified Mariniflexile TaxID=2643887 RepID=UPI000CAF9BAB|nr:hypothetical protein [Mariniflexile sp. TRM1-10]AXP82821.1 hypothetical protein CJ739_3761 [Mariniflexile sp. TRM1-10]PLB19078.1 MAG: Membrane protein [Flavobacteriaceae bacterium FS1-H7996/R]
MIKYLTFGISISVISWIVGMILNSILLKTEYYKKISNLNFIESKTLNKNIGIEYFKWIIKNTFFKFFNQKIKLENKKTELTEVRREMTIAEISHLIGFIFVTFIAIYKSVSHNYLFGLTIMVVNILMNLYPSLLQQENKRRIDKLIKRQVKTVVNNDGCTSP